MHAGAPKEGHRLRRGPCRLEVFGQGRRATPRICGSGSRNDAGLNEKCSHLWILRPARSRLWCRAVQEHERHVDLNAGEQRREPLSLRMRRRPAMQSRTRRSRQEHHAHPYVRDRSSAAAGLCGWLLPLLLAQTLRLPAGAGSPRQLSIGRASASTLNNEPSRPSLVTWMTAHGSSANAELHNLERIDIGARLLVATNVT